MKIEEKAKAYDEAIEKSKEFYILCKKCGAKDTVDFLEEIFPEFKESEDEKVKRIIHSISNKISFHLHDIFTEEEFQCFDAWSNAWLEKQGKEDSSIQQAYKQGYIEGQRIERKCWLEKQGEQPKEATYTHEVETGNGNIKALVTEKVQLPKFKVGDWIVWQNKCYKVNYNGCGYELIDQNGLSTSLEYGTIDENAHLWDITKDAKDGDILVMRKTNVTYESIFIFNKIENNRIIQYLHYFTTDAGEEVCEARSIDGFLGFVGYTVHPAAKEQRETLMKAMADAGWEFDFEKKKLKKIVQKWTEEDKSVLQGIWDEILANKHDAKEVDWKTYDKYLDWLKSLKQRMEEYDE